MIAPLLRSVAIMVALSAAAEAQVARPRFRETPMTPRVEPVLQPQSEAALRADVRFVGARAFDDEELRDAIARQLAQIEKRGLKETRANDAAFFLELFYRRRGFTRATVDYAIANGGLRLTIHEGPLTQIARVTFTGNRQVASETLYDYLIGTTRERFSRFRDELPYVEADIETGVARLRSFYASQGFLHTRVEPAIVRISRNRTEAFLTIRIHEGRQYFFGAITFAGERVLPRSELLAPLHNELARPYSELQVETMRGDLEHLLKTRGYFKAEVAANAEPEAAVKGRVPVTFTLSPGGFYRFDGVTAQGLERLPDDFLRKRFAGLRGDPYNPERIEELYRELMRTGLFEYLTFEQTALPGGLVRLDFTAQEAKAKELAAYAGYGTYEGAVVGASYTDRNFLGRGRPLTLSAEIAQRGLAGEILYEDPWLFDTRNRLRLRLYAIAEEQDEYTRGEQGARAELARKLTEQLEIAAFLHGKNTSISEARIEERLLGPSEYQLATIGLTHTYDRRKDPTLAQRGFAASSTLSYSAGGSDVSFARATLRLSYYLPIGETLLAAGVRVGSIFGSGGFENVPVDERFFTGGSTSVRSFPERELGPQDRGGKPVGGLSRGVLNVEYVFPLAGDLKGAVFADAGSVSKDSLAPFEDLRFALGAGLRYQLPIGPLRLDYGWNPARRRDEPEGALHLSFGFAF